MSNREALLLKKYGNANSSEEDSDNDSSESSSKEKEIQPTFIPKESRKIINIPQEVPIISQTKEQKESQYQALLKMTSSPKNKIHNESEELSRPEFAVDDTDDIDDLVEFENWKIRELNRIKRDLEENYEKEREKNEIERRRGLTNEQREEENIKLGSDNTLRTFKSKINFLQKYYHKGAFFQDEASGNSEHIYNRDYNLPTWEDKVDRSNLPGIMAKRRGNLFKKGQSKYTHLTNEDTSNFDPNFKVPENIANRLMKNSGGYKSGGVFTAKK